MSYPGGKNGAGVYQTIINQIPPHDTYIEPFAGSAAIFRKKAPARHAILIDKRFIPLPNWREGPGVERLQGDAITYLQKLRCRRRMFVYCDPPYVRSTRRSPRLMYEHEMTDGQHRQLLTILQGLNCMVAISGYWSSLYEEILQNWRLVQFSAVTRGGPATECLWMNYPEPIALHDYQYLGSDFRQRERIRRKAKRWADRLLSLPEIEKRGILSEFMAREDLASLFLTGLEGHQK